MPRTRLTPARPPALPDGPAPWGPGRARRAGADALASGRDARERSAQAAAAGLLAGTPQGLPQRPADAPAGQQPCPACGRLCPLASEDRTAQAPGGGARP